MALTTANTSVSASASPRFQATAPNRSSGVASAAAIAWRASVIWWSSSASVALPSPVPVRRSPGKLTDEVIDLVIGDDQPGEVTRRLTAVAAEAEGGALHHDIGEHLPCRCRHDQIIPRRVATATAWARLRQFIFINTSWTMFLTVRSE